MTQQMKSFSIEDLTSTNAQRKIIPLGFPKQKALVAAIATVLALVPEDKREEAKKALHEAVKDNETCLSLGIDATTGVVNSQDWAILSAHPDRLGRTVILGGAYKRVRQGQRGQYVQTVVRTPYPIINGILKALGVQPAPAPRPVYGMGGMGFGGAVAPQGFQPTGVAGGTESQVAEEDPNSAGGDDFPL